MKPTDRLQAARTGLESLLSSGAFKRCRQLVREDVIAAVVNIRTAQIALTAPKPWWHVWAPILTWAIGVFSGVLFGIGLVRS